MWSLRYTIPMVKFKKLLIFLTFFLILFSLSTLFLSNKFFIFDIFSHFHLQYFLIFLILFLFLLFLRVFDVAFISLGYLLFIGYFFIFPIQVQESRITSVDVFYMNVLFYNENMSAIAEHIENITPHTVAITEINEELTDLLIETFNEPHVYHAQAGLSCAIFSTRESLRSYVVEEEYPICVTEFSEYVVILIHPVPPLSSERYKIQRNHFGFISALMNEYEKRGVSVLLVGDFNSTYYSGLFRRYFGHLHHKNFYTWENPSPLMIPIDHALSNMPLEVALGPSLGSDHRALYVRFLD
jgi:endonuclease/exonuclease/phosphatase (EEP) superfamily protein YafD